MQLKHLQRTFTAAMLTLVATAAYGQDRPLTAKIPFAFRAVGSDLPAGTYKLAAMSSASGTMQLSNADTGKSVFIHSKGGPVSESQNARPRLIFKCVDQEGCSLATLWSGTGTGVEFSTPPPTATQRERLETIYFDRVKLK
jgi:hypothetical protein